MGCPRASGCFQEHLQITKKKFKFKYKTMQLNITHGNCAVFHFKHTLCLTNDMTGTTFKLNNSYLTYYSLQRYFVKFSNDHLLCQHSEDKLKHFQKL